MKKQNTRIRGKESEEELCCAKAVFAETSSDAMWAIDHNYFLIWGNQTFDQQAKELIGHTITPGQSVFGTDVPEDVAGQWRNFYDRVLTTGEQFVVEVNSVKLPVQQRIEYTFEPIKDKNGNISGVAIVGKDLTKHADSFNSPSYLLDILNSNEKLTKTGSWQWDVKSQTMSWSDQTYAIHDFQPGEFTEKSNELIAKSIECYNPEDRPKIFAAFQQCINKGIPYDLRFQFKSAKGRKLWIRTIGHPISENGNVVKVVGNIQDITKQVNDEEMIRQSEEKFRALIEQTNQALFLHDMDGNIVEVNKATTRMTGYTTEELLQLTVFDIDPNIESRFDRNTIWYSIEPHIEKDFETRHRRKDGSTYPVEISLSKIRFGNNNYILALAKDITERKLNGEKQVENQKYLRAILDAVSDAIFINDAETGQIIDVNDGMCKMYGLTRDEALLSEVGDLSYGLSPYTQEEAMEWLRKARDMGPQHFEWLARRKNGNSFFVDISIQYLEIEGKNRYIVIAHDISERKQKEQIMASRLKLLELKDKLTLPELLQATLDEAEKISGSQVGFYHFVEDDQVTIALQAWSTNTITKECKAEGIGLHYPLQRAGVWADSIRERRPVVHNDYHSLPNRLGLPKGHTHVTRELVIPVIRNNQVAAVIGVGNKNTDYTVSDIENIGSLADLAWEILENKRAEEAIRKSEKEFKDIFESAPVGIYRTSKDGSILMANPFLLNMLEYESFDELAKRNLDNEGFDVQSPRALFLEKIEEDGEVHNFESVWETRTGKKITVSENARKINDENGLLIYFEGMVEDITERKEIEISLKKSEAQSRALLNAIPDMMFRMNRQGIYLGYKAAHEDLYYQKNELIGKSNRDITPPEFADLVGEKINCALSTGEIQLFEYQLKIPGKGLQDYEARIVPSGEDEIIAIVRNITESKKNRQKIIESEANLRAIIEATDDVFILLDKNGTVLESNEIHARRLGLTRDELLGKNVFELLPAEIGYKRKSFVEEAFRSGKPNRNEDVRAGIWNEISIYPVKIKDQKVEKVAVFAKNITEKKENELKLTASEEKFRGLFENMTQGVFYQAADGFLIDANNAALNLLGLGRSQISNTNSNDPNWKVVNLHEVTLTPDQHPSIMALTSGKAVKDHIIGIYNAKLKKYTWLIVNAIPQFRPGEEKPFQVFVTLQDITERVELEKEIKRSEQELRELNASKDKFFSIIAHDLKSPFNAIMGFSDLLVDQIRQKDLEGIEEMAEMILKSSTHAMDLVTNLLEWSRSQTGRIKFDPVFVEIVELINNNIEFLKSSIGQKDISIHRELPAIVPIICDPNMINTVVRNLLSNAIKFTEPGGIITISITRNPKEIDVSVRDTGIGISTANLSKLFRIDSNFSTPGTNMEKGTGLGLILCKEFVEKHRGKIVVESEPGKGSIFTFTLPKYV